jgi:hypothetical protein
MDVVAIGVAISLVSVIQQQMLNKPRRDGHINKVKV